MITVKATLTSLGAALILACATTGGTTGSVPAWYTNLEADFPDAEFLAQDGSGDTQRAAEEDARGELAKRFSVKVKSDTTAEMRYKEFVKGSKAYSETEKELVSNTESTTDQTLANVRYSAPYRDPRGQVHIVAFFKRSEATTLWRGMINKDVTAIEGLKARALKAESGIMKLALIDTAAQIAYHADVLVAQLQIINSGAAKMAASSVDSAGLLALRDQLTKDIGYTVAIEGDTGSVQAMAAKALETLGIRYSAKGKMKLAGKLSLDKDAARNPAWKGVRWTLNLSLTDETGAVVASFFKEDLEEAISEAEAKAFAIQSIEKTIKKDLVKKVTAYMTNVATGAKDE